jgi:hypothetical protein
MPIQHPKSVRRFILQKLYDAYMADPLDMLSPEAFLDGGEIDRHGLAVAIHYLRDDGLVEVMLGYQPPLFTSARITPRGVDVVENEYEFNRRFPPESLLLGEESAGVARWMEQLIAEADLCSLPQPQRAQLLRDLQYLRAEIAQPYEAWRHKVLRRTLKSIAKLVKDDPVSMPAFEALNAALRSALEPAKD